MQSKKTKTTTLLLMFATSLNFGIAKAATVKPENTSELIVTGKMPRATVAKKTATNEIAAPAPSSNAVEKIDIDQETVYAVDDHSLAQLINMLPSATLNNAPRSIAQTPTVRGLSQSQIVVAIDNIQNPFNNFGHNNLQLLPSPYLLKSIEVGSPSNMTYGTGNEGGSLNFVTVEPDDYMTPDKKNGMLLTEAAQTGAPGFLSAVTLFGQYDRWKGLFKILTNHYGEVKTGNHHTVPYSAETDLDYLGKLYYQPNQHETWKLSVFSQKNDGKYPAIISGVVNSVNAPSDISLLNQQQTLQYFYKPNQPWIDFEAVFYHLNTKQTLKPLADSRGFSIPQDIRLTMYGLNLQNKSQVHEKHLLTYGLQGAKQQGHDNEVSGTTGNFPNAERTQSAAFLQDTIKVTQRLTAILGLRADQDQSHGHSLSQHNFFLGKKAELQYQLTSQLTPYLSYAENFRYPTLSELYLGGLHPGNFGKYGPILSFLPNASLKPEESHYMEGGSLFNKNNAFANDDNLEIKFSAFLNRIYNYIALNPVAIKFPLYQFQYTNISRAHVYGYSMNANYRYHEISTYVTAAFTRGYNDVAYTGETVFIPAGSALAGITPLRATGGIVFPVKKILGEIQLQLNLNKAQHDVPPGVQKQSGYATMDAYYRGKTNIKALTFAIGIENLTNKYYSVYNNAPNLLPAMGRNVSLTLNYLL